MKLKTGLKFSVFMLAIAFMPLVSCSDDDNTSPSGGGGNGGGGDGSGNPAQSMSVKIDGTLKTFKRPYGISYERLISLVGSDEKDSSDYTKLSITIRDNIKAGTYSLPTMGSSGYITNLSYSNAPSNYLRLDEGSITILSNDTIKKQLIGTFEATLSNNEDTIKVILTEGKFNLTHYALDE